VIDASSHRGSLSPLVHRIAGRGAAAWALHQEAMAAKRRGEDVIVMSVGDPDIATPPSVIDAAVDALRAGDTHYTPIVGRSSLRAAIAERYAGRTGLEVDPDQVVILAGAQNGLFACALGLTAPGDEVIVPVPMYVTYEATIGAAGARVVPVPCDPAGGFRPDLHRLESAITPRTRALFLANPNNPTGVVMNRGELEAVADLARRHDLWVVSDEVYANLVFDGEHLSIGALPKMAERTVTVSSLSKSHAMPGWRTGWAIAPPALVPHLANLALCMLYGLPGFVQAAALEALTGSDGESTRMRERFRLRRNAVLDSLAGLKGIHSLKPQAGMFLLMDVRGTGLGSAEFTWKLYRASGVSLLDAAPFGAADGFVRLSFSGEEAELEEGCRRIAAFVAGLQVP
jgi:arginine:pyruvate transaminase